MARLVKFGNFADTVTYWGNPVADGSGGTAFDAPVTITARWEQRSELAADLMGEQFLSHARVYFDTQELDVGGYLYLGTSAEADPNDVDGAFPIRNVERIPALRGVGVNRKAIL